MILNIKCILCIGYWIFNLSLSVLLFQSVQTVLSCTTLNSIAVCLLAHVGIVHSDHTPLLTVKQVCLFSSMTTVKRVKLEGQNFGKWAKQVVLTIIILAFQHLQLNTHPAFILAQHLANNHPFAIFVKFYPIQYFPLYGNISLHTCIY